MMIECILRLVLNWKWKGLLRLVFDFIYGYDCCDGLEP